MGEFQVIHLGKVSFQLKEKHNFEWLLNMGEVFAVFDEQDSGNICFGIKNDGIKKFVKYAGAKTKEYTGQPEEAIVRLKKSVPIYKELEHKHLITLLEYFEVERGYVLVFEWFEGECLHAHWSFPPPQKYTHPASPYYRFKQLPIERRLSAFKSILEFHLNVEQKHYIAIDFYDGSILYDFKNHITKICDVDLYKKKPFINTMGRLWGSSRFMSPEEFELGAAIDERSNVFTMGAIAFGLLGGELDRSLSKWEAGQNRYQAARKAVKADRCERYATIEEFNAAWESLGK
ncbi:serine/threonine protein kinase [Peribacillus sp. FSL H8-0477]|uniref:protein kinase domain-containing protein n=1 Tax=Peribacillus sp. FSL H8-0477 TaxID=2921388 RepID=UPI0030FBAFFF